MEWYNNMDPSTQFILEWILIFIGIAVVGYLCSRWERKINPNGTQTLREFFQDFSENSFKLCPKDFNCNVCCFLGA